MRLVTAEVVQNTSSNTVLFILEDNNSKHTSIEGLQTALCFAMIVTVIRNS